MPARATRARAIALLTAVAAIGALASTTLPSAAATPRVASIAPPANAWTQFHHDAAGTGYSPDPLLGAASAPGLGVRWMANTTSPIYDSPVVAYNAETGRTLAYVGDQAGYMTAFDVASGAVVWSRFLGSAIQGSALVENGSVWISDVYNPHLFKLDGGTGTTECSAQLVSVVDSSPTIGTPPGGSPTVYIGANDYGTSPGPMYGIDEATCHTDFAFTGYHSVTGSWDSVAYATDANGRALVVFGTADPDSEVYAIDARTGALDWRFATANPTGKADVGAGASISAPGVNGFADGVAYIPGKDGILYALDLTTGAAIWQYTFGTTSISTPSLDGTQLVFGSSAGVVDLNAVTGALIWKYSDPAQVLSATSVIGAPGDEMVAFSDLAGRVQAISLASGALLYSYQTHGYAPGSVADVDGNLLVGSSDGFLYDLALGGGNGASPTTAISGPAPGATVANPDGSVTISGSATAPDAVATVDVAVQSGGIGGLWWNAASGTWSSGPVANPATLSLPGATATGWSIHVPVPVAGTGLRVVASAVDADGIADTSGDRSTTNPASLSFTVAPDPAATTIQASATRVAPGTTFTVTGTGFAPGEQVALTLPTQPATLLATLTATTTGVLVATPVLMPTAATTGAETLTATGVSSGAVGTTSLMVSNDWAQWRDAATRTGFEANDPILNQTTAISEATYVQPVWGLPSGAAIHDSPAVVGGVAYFGNDAGTVYAVNVVSGAPLWTVSVGSAVTSSPAVDAGEVIFGTAAGQVLALNSTTGAVAWTAATGAAVESSPAVAAGTVYVGSDDGNLYALSEATGARAWTWPLAGAVRSSPMVDAGRRTVVVGDDSGAVTALTLPRGKVLTPALKWTYATAAAVRATPMLSGTTVYVGSESGVVSALAELTGAVVWTYTTGGPVDASPAKLNNTVVFGSGNGTVYYLGATTGAVSNTISLGSPIVGVSTVQAFALVTTAGGAAYGLRPTGDITNWQWHSSAGLSSSPTVVNGSVYVTGLDQVLHVFTPPGRSVY